MIAFIPKNNCIVCAARDLDMSVSPALKEHSDRSSGRNASTLSLQCGHGLGQLGFIA